MSKAKVSPASVVEKSWIGIPPGGILFPWVEGRAPERKVTGFPSVKNVAKVPPIAPATEEVPGAKVIVELVKESLPLALKNPLMESAWATAALLIAKAVNTTRRLSMVISVTG
jgi:hypothetical protein